MIMWTMSISPFCSATGLSLPFSRFFFFFSRCGTAAEGDGALYFFALLSFHGLLEDKIYLIEYNTLLLLIGPAFSEFLEELRISVGKKRQKQGYRIRP